MFTLSKTFRFEAAHKLPSHDGKCARLHGHSWVMHIVLEAENVETKGPKAGMLVDFGDISKEVKPFVDEVLDHHYLNETTQLENPTSEELARYIFHQFDSVLPHLKSVQIDETCTSSCCYQPKK